MNSDTVITSTFWADWSGAYVDRFAISHDGGVAMMDAWFDDVAVKLRATPADLDAVLRLLVADPPKAFGDHPAKFFGALRSVIGTRRAMSKPVPASGMGGAETRSAIAQLRERWTRDGYAWRNGKTRKAART